MTEKEGIGVALSGGGVRAVVFHAGVFKWLSEENELQNVLYISSVSGGSLLVGLVFHFNNYKWPSSEEYLTTVLPSICSLLTKASLQSEALRNLVFKPWNWRYILSRANIISNTIESLWDIKAVMRDLPVSPMWAINGTTGENGRRFRIKRNDFGDYETGYADISSFKLADAMSVSAAFPVGIGPFALKTKGFNWKKQKNWDSDESKENINPPFKKMHLYDGGVYDNLGIEPLFDIGNQKIKKQENGALKKIIVSDASTPLVRKKIPSPISPFRIKRLIDIMLDQVRSLRVRSFVNFIKNNPGKGAYYQLGSDPTASIKKYGDLNIKSVSKLFSSNWLDTYSIHEISTYPTTLNRMMSKDISLLIRHGYETAKWNDCLWKINNNNTIEES
ncbi:MAG: patatin-like phospholipase family protein [Patescibacteria group bacterium]|nr:patatin-like phospholipase family protein [Patescibacteria group bacterium]